MFSRLTLSNWRQFSQIDIEFHPRLTVLTGAANRAQWTAEYLAARAADTVTDTIRYRYRHQDIKAALRAEAFEKWVYCETKISVGETDHINPVVQP